MSVRLALTPLLSRAPAPVLALYAMAAAFTTYFCMYAFRKPFLAAEFAGDPLGSFDLKSALAISQVIGYALSKFIGVKVCSETTRGRRALSLVLLIAWAEAALLLFAVLPSHWKIVAIFLNGISLGMVWGMVVGYLEGRQTSDALLAALCCSFIVAGGAVKDVGLALMNPEWLGTFAVSESWMPAATGALFALPFFLSVWLLNQMPRPTQSDMDARVERQPMDRYHRRVFLKQFLPGLVLLFTLYFFLTAFRDFRDIFGIEIFNELGFGEKPAIFTRTELWVALGVTAAMALLSLIRNNQRAFLGVFAMMTSGTLLLGLGTWLFDAGLINGDTWMVLVGLGAYLAYVPFNAVLFERLIATTHVVGTAVFAIYVADGIGYTGSIGLLFYKNLFESKATYLDFFRGFTYLLSVAGTTLLVTAYLYFRIKHHHGQHAGPTEKPRRAL